MPNAIFFGNIKGGQRNSGADPFCGNAIKINLLAYRKAAAIRWSLDTHLRPKEGPLPKTGADENKNLNKPTIDRCGLRGQVEYSIVP